MAQTLLQKAKKIKAQKYRGGRKAGKQDVEILLAYFNNEVTITQIGKVYKVNGGAIYCILLASVKEAIKEGIIKIKTQKP